MDSSSSSSNNDPQFLLDGVTPVKDLRGDLTDALTSADLDLLAEECYSELLEDVILGLALDSHMSAKTGVTQLTEIPASSSTSASSVVGVDVFGQVITTAVGVPTLKKQPECVCPNCQRNLAASRFAPHLEKCMGMGRNSSRLASRRLANNSKDSYRESGGNDEEDDAEDEDWIEPRLAFGGGSQGGGGTGTGSGSASSQSFGGGNGNSQRRKRDKNSPRRTKSAKSKSGESTPQEGAITPPTSYDILSVEERAQWLASICGVISLNSRKICSRSTRCPVHTDQQRREVRLKWLDGTGTPGAPPGTGDESHNVDIDSFTEGDTAALRESLALLSNASSPAESTISTSSELSHHHHHHHQPSQHRGGTRRREKASRRNKKGKAGAGGSSRGSTPPLME